ncbi:hypothetical protein EPO05_03120 [Patescibacteria group bacterium]|nr:MAG: hypothetical protein EPO05_03120 [Patescibacteria group bacterium]
MEYNNSINKAMEQIKTEHVVPKPKWEFALENVFKWILFVVSGIIGALFLLFLYNSLADADWDIRPRAGLGILKLIFLILPPIWVILLTISVALAYLLFRSTRYGYRYSGQSAFFIVLGTVVVVGIISFFAKADKFVGNRMPGMIPGYGQAMLMREEMWLHPESGLLGGVVTSLDKNARTLTVRDFQGGEWVVVPGKDFKAPRLILETIVGKQVKIIGEKTGEFQFQANEIRPWNERFERPMGPGGPMPMRPMMRGRGLPIGK